MSSKLTCIVCPIGCQLEVAKIDTGGYVVNGHTCQQGKEYAEMEMTSPVRVLTTTIKLNHSSLKRLPVKTDGAIPKEKIFEIMKKIRQYEVPAPVKLGEIIIPDILDTGCNIVATANADAMQKVLI